MTQQGEYISSERRVNRDYTRNFSLRSQLAAEQSRCFKLEVAEVRQKIKTMETLENKLELLHRQRAVASEQAAANMNGKRQSSGDGLLELFRQKHESPMKVSASGQSYSRTEEINNAFTNEVSWDRSSTSSTQAPTHRPSKRTYGAI
ncbi:acyl-CoA-binding domain-containing protein 6 [Brassica napus]|uniref:acyl-CoA-binding domain-containing protein 6 n=1 Tax=Brassica napus TaxID=3708 RepID=UPI0006AAAA2C|nr:acyl-CoA-binding domain-containing protein 6 [Brassica napus]